MIDFPFDIHKLHTFIVTIPSKTTIYLFYMIMLIDLKIYLLTDLSGFFTMLHYNLIRPSLSNIDRFHSSIFVLTLNSADFTLSHT